VLIFLAMDKKYLLISFDITWWLLIEVPPIFKVVALSVFLVLLVSNLTISQIVLFLFKELFSLSA
jgi:hypothetical protein